MTQIRVDIATVIFPTEPGGGVYLVRSPQQPAHRFSSRDKPMRRRTHFADDPEIKRLRDELAFARRTIIELGTELALEYEGRSPPADADNVAPFPGTTLPTPEPLTPLDRLLSDYNLCETDEDFWGWLHVVICRIVEIEQRVAAPPPHGGSARSYCPLCRGGVTGSQNYFGEYGYAVPEGLERHLRGSGSPACSVLRALEEQAQESLRRTLAHARELAEHREAAHRRSERMFFVDPLGPPELLDEGSHWWLGGGGVRSAKDLVAAEERLCEIGFTTEADGNVVAYKYRQEPYTVLADPGRSGRLLFRVYDEAQLAKASGPRNPRIRALSRRSSLVEQFHLLDSWRRDLAGKFQMRLRNATTALESSARGAAKE